MGLNYNKYHVSSLTTPRVHPLDSSHLVGWCRGWVFNGFQDSKSNDAVVNWRACSPLGQQRPENQHFQPSRAFSLQVACTLASRTCVASSSRLSTLQSNALTIKTTGKNLDILRHLTCCDAIFANCHLQGCCWVGQHGKGDVALLGHFLGRSSTLGTGLH